MKKLKCVLIDDEPRNLKLLTYYIEKYCKDLHIEAAFSKRVEAEDYLKDENKRSAIDILFWISFWTRELALTCSIKSILRIYT